MILSSSSLGVDSWNRMEVMLENRPYTDYDDWLIQLGEMWSLCDRIADHREVLAEILARLDRRQLDLLMTEEECAFHRALPALVQVWRGCYDFNRGGLSWSLSREIAAEFTSLARYNHPDRTPLLLSGWVHRDHIAVKLDRDEQEVIAYNVHKVQEAVL